MQMFIILCAVWVTASALRETGLHFAGIFGDLEFFPLTKNKNFWIKCVRKPVGNVDENKETNIFAHLTSNSSTSLLTINCIFFQNTCFIIAIFRFILPLFLIVQKFAPKFFFCLKKTSLLKQREDLKHILFSWSV